MNHTPKFHRTALETTNGGKKEVLLFHVFHAKLAEELRDFSPHVLPTAPKVRAFGYGSAEPPLRTCPKVMVKLSNDNYLDNDQKSLGVLTKSR